MMTPDDLLELYQMKRADALERNLIAPNTTCDIEVWMITPDIALEAEKDHIRRLLESFHALLKASDPTVIEVNVVPALRQHRGEKARVLVVLVRVRIPAPSASETLGGTSAP